MSYNGIRHCELISKKSPNNKISIDVAWSETYVREVLASSESERLHYCLQHQSASSENTKDEITIGIAFKFKTEVHIYSFCSKDHRMNIVPPSSSEVEEKITVLQCTEKSYKAIHRLESHFFPLLSTLLSDLASCHNFIETTSVKEIVTHLMENDQQPFLVIPDTNGFQLLKMPEGEITNVLDRMRVQFNFEEGNVSLQAITKTDDPFKQKHWKKIAIWNKVRTTVVFNQKFSYKSIQSYFIKDSDDDDESATTTPVVSTAELSKRLGKFKSWPIKKAKQRQSCIDTMEALVTNQESVNVYNIKDSLPLLFRAISSQDAGRIKQSKWITESNDNVDLSNAATSLFNKVSNDENADYKVIISALFSHFKSDGVSLSSFSILVSMYNTFEDFKAIFLEEEFGSSDIVVNILEQAQSAFKQKRITEDCLRSDTEESLCEKCQSDKLYALMCQVMKFIYLIVEQGAVFKVVVVVQLYITFYKTLKSMNVAHCEGRDSTRQVTQFFQLILSLDDDDNPIFKIIRENFDTNVLSLLLNLLSVPRDEKIGDAALVNKFVTHYSAETLLNGIKSSVQKNDNISVLLQIILLVGYSSDSTNVTMFLQKILFDKKFNQMVLQYYEEPESNDEKNIFDFFKLQFNFKKKIQGTTLHYHSEIMDFAIEQYKVIFAMLNNSITTTFAIIILVTIQEALKLFDSDSAGDDERKFNLQSTATRLLFAEFKKHYACDDDDNTNICKAYLDCLIQLSTIQSDSIREIFANENVVLFFTKELQTPIESTEEQQLQSTTLPVENEEAKSVVPKLKIPPPPKGTSKTPTSVNQLRVLKPLSLPTKEQIHNQYSQLESKGPVVYKASIVLLLSLLASPDGASLDYRYCCQYPETSSIIEVNLLQILHQKIEANPTLFSTDFLYEVKSTIKHTRLLRLLGRQFFKSEEFKNNMSHLDRGAFGTIYKSTDDDLAIKLLDRPRRASQRCAIVDVYTEVSVLEALRGNPVVPFLHTYGVSDDSYYIVMECAEQNLSQWRSSINDDVWSLELLLLIFELVCKNVQTLHAVASVVHCDLKADNIMLRTRSTISLDKSVLSSYPLFLVDFGESVYYENQRGGHIRGRGTEGIKAPEVLLMANGTSSATKTTKSSDDSVIKINPSADVWSLGCLFYELCAASPLFQTDNWSEFFVHLTKSTSGVVPNEAAKRLYEALKDNRQSFEFVMEILNMILIRDAKNRPSIGQILQKVNSTRLALSRLQDSDRSATTKRNSKLLKVPDNFIALTAAQVVVEKPDDEIFPIVSDNSSSSSTAEIILCDEIKEWNVDSALKLFQITRHEVVPRTFYMKALENHIDTVIEIENDENASEFSIKKVSGLSLVNVFRITTNVKEESLEDEEENEDEEKEESSEEEENEENENEESPEKEDGFEEAAFQIIDNASDVLSILQRATYSQIGIVAASPRALNSVLPCVAIYLMKCNYLSYQEVLLHFSVIGLEELKLKAFKDNLFGWHSNRIVVPQEFKYGCDNTFQCFCGQSMIHLIAPTIKRREVVCKCEDDEDVVQHPILDCLEMEKLQEDSANAGKLKEIYGKCTKWVQTREELVYVRNALALERTQHSAIDPSRNYSTAYTKLSSSHSIDSPWTLYRCKMCRYVTHGVNDDNVAIVANLQSSNDLQIALKSYFYRNEGVNQK